MFQNQLAAVDSETALARTLLGKISKETCFSGCEPG
jgi:hypothetical protein